MKKIAILFLFLFTLVQAAPAISSFFTSSATVFIADEEKGDHKLETEKKENKEKITSPDYSFSFSNKLSTCFHLSEMIHPSPCLEKLTPPPNFC